MTITLFVEPKSFALFISEIMTLKALPMENNYKIDPSKLHYSEEMISSYKWVNVEVQEYIKLLSAFDKFNQSK